MRQLAGIVILGILLGLMLLWGFCWVMSEDTHAKKPVTWSTSLASFYRLYGNKTACGQTRYRGQIGVAHRTLPCGTRLRFRHRGRYVNARVIDRGPYNYSREFDLTEDLKIKLGCRDLCWVQWRLQR